MRRIKSALILLAFILVVASILWMPSAEPAESKDGAQFEAWVAEVFHGNSYSVYLESPPQLFFALNREAWERARPEWKAWLGKRLACATATASGLKLPVLYELSLLPPPPGGGLEDVERARIDFCSSADRRPIKTKPYDH